MIIFNSFLVCSGTRKLVSFSSLCHSAVHFFFHKLENFCVSAMEHLRERGKNQTKSSVNNYEDVFIMH